MIVDASSYSLVNAIESLLEDAGASNSAATTARSSPSSWSRCSRSRRSRARTSTRPASSCARCAARCARPPPRASLTIGSAGTHPFAMWEDQRIVARPRYRDLISALRFVARQELIFGMHVHVGIDDRRQGDPRRQRHARARPGAARAERQLAVLARRPDGLLSTRTPIFRAVPARRHAARLRRLGRLGAPGRVHGRQRRHGGLHVPLVRRAPAPEPRHRRDPLLRLADAPGAHGRADGAHPGDGPRARRALRRGHGARRLPVADARREQVAGGAPRPRRRDRRPALQRARHDEGAHAPAARTPEPHAQELGGADALDGIRDLLERGNGASRQIVVYEANNDLNEVMAEIVAATAL